MTYRELYLQEQKTMPGLSAMARRQPQSELKELSNNISPIFKLWFCLMMANFAVVLWLFI